MFTSVLLGYKFAGEFSERTIAYFIMIELILLCHLNGRRQTGVAVFL